LTERQLTRHGRAGECVARQGSISGGVKDGGATLDACRQGGLPVKRILLLAALCAAPLAQAQWEPDEPDVEHELEQLQDTLDRLRQDDDVIEFAGDELEQAEDYLEELAELPPHQVDPAEIDEAERLLDRVEHVAQQAAVPAPEREVVVVQDDDDEAWREADAARAEADAARASAEEARERALAAKLEAERERMANAQLRAELGQAQTRVTDRGVVLTLGDVLFAVGKAELKPGAARTLDKLASAMRRDRDTTVTIEGHTDSTGKRAYNLALSQRRAQAVRSYLAAKGIPSSRIKARGLGPDFPVASNKTEAGRQQNRRVEVLVQNDAFDD
jgi:outer membrane protein OmpA-like peptidoglycan-associated protein